MYKLSNVESTSLLERYIFAESKTDFLNELVEGSESHRYFSMMHDQNSEVPNTTLEEIMELFNQPVTIEKRKLAFKYLTNRIPQEKDEQLRKKLLDILKNEFYPNYWKFKGRYKW